VRAWRRRIFAGAWIFGRHRGFFNAASERAVSFCSWRFGRGRCVGAAWWDRGPDWMTMTMTTVTGWPDWKFHADFGWIFRRRNVGSVLGGTATVEHRRSRLGQAWDSGPSTSWLWADTVWCKCFGPTESRAHTRLKTTERLRSRDPFLGSQVC
jgi:hypothetical protein